MTYELGGVINIKCPISGVCPKSQGCRNDPLSCDEYQKIRGRMPEPNFRGDYDDRRNPSRDSRKSDKGLGSYFPGQNFSHLGKLSYNSSEDYNSGSQKKYKLDSGYSGSRR